MEIAINMTSSRMVAPSQMPGCARNIAQPWASQSKQAPTSTSRLSPLKGAGAIGNCGLSLSYNFV